MQQPSPRRPAHQWLILRRLVLTRGLNLNSRAPSQVISAPLLAWCVGPEEPTSDEDPNGYVKPKRGEGRLGRGSRMNVFHKGAPRSYVDGAGLRSSWRWELEDRITDPIAPKLRDTHFTDDSGNLHNLLITQRRLFRG